MMGLADIPVTLTIKAPNQRVDDIAVECMLGWTVRKLKQHLESVYPNSPSEDEQKLIYSGKLMDDHLTLKEILRQREEEASIHTVHLVCSPTMSQKPSTENLSSSSSSSSLPESGLRYRGHATAPLPDTVDQNTGNVNPAMYGYPMMPDASGVYSPEQFMYYQQMYAQYMSQYYQYYHSGHAGMFPPQHTAVRETTPPEPANQIPQPRQELRNAAPANQNIRMNAQGGAVMDDDEDEDFAHRDWLDWIYILCRFLVLTSIVYFYSTFQRFMVVFSLFFLIYLYQTGWFRMRRRNEEPQEEQQQPEQPEQPAPERPENPDNTEQNEAESQPEPEPVNQEPPPPSTLTVVWNFCTTLFTSLVPQQPDVVNAN